MLLLNVVSNNGSLPIVRTAPLFLLLVAADLDPISAKAHGKTKNVVVDVVVSDAHNTN